MEYIKINIDKIDIELAQFLNSHPNRILPTNEKVKLYKKFGSLMRFSFSKDPIKREQQLLAVAYLVYLIRQAQKFNQRTGWWTVKYCPLVEKDNPINNVPTKLIVINDEIKIVNKNEYPNSNFYLEFADFDKYKGNAVYFAEIYKEIILKASMFLHPDLNKKQNNTLKKNIENFE